MNQASSKSNENSDPSKLAAVIARNEMTIKQGWAELDRLTQMLEALSAREASIIQNDIKGSKPAAASSAKPSLAAAA